MILNFLSAIWAATAPALGNHLWQSTLCLVVAGLLTLVLRKNSARTRYGIWLAASIKFLLPFSLLIAIGTHWARPRPATPSQPGLFYAMEQASQPFTPAAAPAEKSRGPAQEAGLRYTLVHLLPAILVAAWFCGFVAVVLVWYARWRRIAATVRDAAPLSEGREVEALRSVERLAGIPKPIDLWVSPASLEPGIFGIIRPVLIWPKAMSERLDDAQLRAILAHEVWHVRRRDNLAAAVHMVVEALFWFHPLVWWLTTRLVEERERACDEAVLQVGSERQVYAESILKTCEFCLESPLPCVAGVTGADLKKRIVRIMTQRVVTKVSIGKKLLLAALGAAAVAGPVIFGIIEAPQASCSAQEPQQTKSLQFEVASIRPSNPQGGGVNSWSSPGLPGGLFRMVSMPLKQWVEMALSVSDYALKAPSWLDRSRFDLDARLPAGMPNNQEARAEMMKALLIERFGLKWHEERRLVSGYELVAGPKVLVKASVAAYAGGRSRGPALIGGTDMPMSELAVALGEVLRRPVVDATHLSGGYDIKLRWRPFDDAGVADAKDSGMKDVDSLPSIFTALREQLGLRLQSAKVPFNVIVVDRINPQPTEN